MGGPSADKHRLEWGGSQVIGASGGGQVIGVSDELSFELSFFHYTHKVVQTDT